MRFFVGTFFPFLWVHSAYTWAWRSKGDEVRSGRIVSWIETAATTYIMYATCRYYTTDNRRGAKTALVITSCVSGKVTKNSNGVIVPIAY